MQVFLRGISKPLAEKNVRCGAAQPPTLVNMFIMLSAVGGTALHHSATAESGVSFFVEKY